MRSGELRHRVNIERPSLTRDAVGGVSRTWTSVEERWAKIEPLTARELFEAQQINERVSHRVTIRYCSWLTSAYRFVESSRVFSIGSILNPNEINRETVCLCIEEIDLSTGTGSGSGSGTGSGSGSGSGA